MYYNYKQDCKKCVTISLMRVILTIGLYIDIHVQGEPIDLSKHAYYYNNLSTVPNSFHNFWHIGNIGYTYVGLL